MSGLLGVGDVVPVIAAGGTRPTVAWTLIAAGFGFSFLMGWLRNRPSRLQESTQHLAIAGMLGTATAIAGIVLLLFFCD